MKQSFWKADWFLSLLIVIAFLFAARSDLLQSLERKAYDLGVQASSRRAPTASQISSHSMRPLPGKVRIP